ncbi:hypothetical protein Dimus_001136 [Dionaea muscipula]
MSVAHPRLMWSYDSAKHRDLRVRSVVERTLREGMGSEDEDSRPVLPDFAVSVDPMVDLATAEVVELDLKALIDGLSLTMAENLNAQSFAVLDAQGNEVGKGQSMVQVPSLGSVIPSDGDGSELLEAVLPETRVVPSVITSAPAMRFGDGEEVQEIDAGPDAALSPPCPLVSYPSSPRSDGLRVVAAEDRGSTTVKGPSPEVSALSVAGGGHDLGNSLAVLKTVGLGIHLAAVTVGNSVNPETSLSYHCPSLRADSVDYAAPMLSHIDGTLIEGGMVSEEGLVSLAAREALRLSPTDGWRQPPLSPVEPAMVTMRGGLMPGGGQASRSYAHVVHADRRADVELSFIPPADGENSIMMEESDGDAERWGACLVGYFLQSSLPFGYVRSSVSRQWTKLGLTEVQSRDDGFFVFRFADSISRDGV